MDAIGAIKGSLATAEMVSMAYLGDLTDQELLQRPHAQCDHLNWQIGHLICSENKMMSSIAADIMPALPDGFASQYTRETASSTEPSSFATKDELMATYQAQRAGTLAILATMNPQQLDEETGVDYAPTKGDMLRMTGEHWLMHCGQWVVVRRICGKPVVI